MSENVTIARPYASAAFELAAGADALGPWSEALERLAALAADPQMHECINSPQLNDEQLSALFIELAGDALDGSMQNFVRVLGANDRLQVLPEIRDLFVELKNEHEGVEEAMIASAFPLEDAALAALKSDLEARFKKRLNVQLSVDPELIGGVRITIGDEVIDASVRGKLANMATALKN